MTRRSGLNRRQMLGGGAGLTGLALVGHPAGVPRATALEGPGGASAARIADHLSRYANFGNKRSGGAGELAAADWIADALRNAGFAVEQEDFDVPHFAPDTARIAAADAQIEVLPQPVVVPTGPSGIRAEGVLVRDRHEASRAHGRIAFLVLPHARHAAIFGPAVLALLELVLAAGPLAVVVVPTGPTGLIVGLNARLRPIAPVPVAVMAPRDLDPVSAAVATGQPLTLTIAGTAGTLRSRNLIARRTAGPRWLAFSTPRAAGSTASASAGRGPRSSSSCAPGPPGAFRTARCSQSTPAATSSTSPGPTWPWPMRRRPSGPISGRIWGQVWRRATSARWGPVRSASCPPPIRPVR